MRFAANSFLGALSVSIAEAAAGRKRGNKLPRRGGEMQPVLNTLCLLLLTMATGVTSQGQCACREVSFVDGEREVVLNCSDPSYAHSALVQWRWTDLSAVRKDVRLVQILNGKVVKHEERAGAELSVRTCIDHGDCSLTLNPRRDDAGYYHCVVWTSKLITETKICLVLKGSKTIYIMAGVCGGAMLVAILVISIFVRRARNRARSSESQMHRQNSVNVEPTYTDLNLAERHLYSNLNARSSDCQMHRQNSVNVEPTYTGLNLAERHLYSNLNDN